MKILVVHPGGSLRSRVLRALHELVGTESVQAVSPLDAPRLIAANAPDLVVLDARSEGAHVDGIATQVRRCGDAVLAMVGETDDFPDSTRIRLLAPCHRIAIDGDLEARLRLVVASAEAEEPPAPERPSLLIGGSPAMCELRNVIARISRSDRPVLVSGPSGSGKELVVGEIHTRSRPLGSPLLDINCGALPAPLFESQLFGYERGAFTGATQSHEGLLAAAGEGTVFLDELAELPLELQPKLLRVLEGGTYRPVGARQNRRFKGRIVAATHVDLAARVAAGRFREDLFYRVNVLEVTVPSLDERNEDIPQLAAFFGATQQRPLVFDPAALDVLRRTRWPGNVRQLRNFVDRVAVSTSDKRVSADAVTRLLGPRQRRMNPGTVTEIAEAILELPPCDKLRLIEQALVDAAMQRSAGNKSAAARMLGVHRKVVERVVSDVDVDVDVSP